MFDLVQALREAKPPREAAFDNSEYLNRMERARASMRARGLDVLIVRNVANICYLSGYLTQMTSWYVTLVLPMHSNTFVHVNEGETALVLIHGPIEDIVTIPWRRSGEAPEDLANALHARGLAKGRIGIETQRYPLNVDTYLRLKKGLPAAHLVDASNLILELRISKSTAEIAHIRRAATLSLVGLDAALDETRLGSTENDVAAAAYASMVRAGSEHVSQPPTVQAGRRTGWGSSVTWKRGSLAPEGPIVIGVTGTWYRYGAPVYRTAVIGKPDDDTRRLADTARGAYSALIDAVRPGRTINDLVAVARKPLAGLSPDVQLNGSFGRSIGVGLVPSLTEGSLEIAEDSERQIEPNMVFATEIGLRIPGKVGVTVGGTWMVTDAGYEVLTGTNSDLVVRPL